MSGQHPPHVKAASEDLSYLRMEEDLTCPVCLELYADPLMLPCSHSVCKKCLGDIITSRAKAGKEGLECPSCRNQHSLSEERMDRLPRNLALENIVFRFQELQSSSIAKSKSLDLTGATPFSSLDLTTLDLPVFAEESSTSSRVAVASEFACGMCEEGKESVAAWFCQQCAVLYCEKCLEKFHPKRGSLAHHRLTQPTRKDCGQMKEQVTNCADHAEEATSIFCGGCQVLVCHLCVCEGTGRHARHKILDLDTAWVQVKESLCGYKDRLESMISVTEERRQKTDQLIHEIERMQATTNERLSLQYDRLIQDLTTILNHHKTSTLRYLDSIFGARMNACSTHSAVITGQSQQLHSLMQRCKGLLQETRLRQVLRCSGEAPPLGQQVQELETQHAELASTHKHLCGDREALSRIQRSVTEFRASAFHLLSKVAGDATGMCTVITPTIRSMMVTSPGKNDTSSSSSSLESQSPSPSPRAGNRTLISWGFNSTTFSAEPLTQSSQWMVTVEKNTSKIGNIHSGYLFGVGVAHDSLSSKDQVGMTATSAGVVCSNGSLAFCRHGQMENIMSLDELPVSVTLCITMGGAGSGGGGAILTYLLSVPGWSQCLMGKAVLDVPVSVPVPVGEGGVCSKMGRLFPAFTVSQRVKMQFTSSSTL